MDDLTKKLNQLNTNITIKNIDGLECLKELKDESIDLILTDPPYIISKESGMNIHFKNVQNANENVKTEDEWLKYKSDKNITDDVNKEKLSEVWYYIW